MKKQRTYHIISMGCPKNDVDSNSMGQLLNHNGFHFVGTPDAAEIVIVNTCGFIASARDENYKILEDCARTKKKGQFLIASGCLTERYREEVTRRVQGIDGILGTRRWMDILQVIEEVRGHEHPGPIFHLPETSIIGTDPLAEDGRPLTVRAHASGASAYLKIADGCRRPCAFCSIPLIKGSMVSRPQEAIINDAIKLRDQGIRELILIAQDTTDYGYDLGIRDGLAKLLGSLVKTVPDMDWIRVMYSYPGTITDRLIDLMASHPTLIPYLDIPLQHAAPTVLSLMRRPADIQWTYRTIEKMRNSLNNLAIRTSFIVGFPNEGESEFLALLDFVQAIRFDRVGVFQYSFERGTYAEYLGDPIPAAIKQERHNRLMELQQGISLQINNTWIGKTLDVLVEGIGPNKVTIGRSYRDAPEIDGLVLVEGEYPIGKFISVKITGALEYDLSGVPAGTPF